MAKVRLKVQTVGNVSLISLTATKEIPVETLLNGLSQMFEIETLKADIKEEDGKNVITIITNNKEKVAKLRARMTVKNLGRPSLN